MASDGLSYSFTAKRNLLELEAAELVDGSLARVKKPASSSAELPFAFRCIVYSDLPPALQGLRALQRRALKAINVID